MELAPDCLLGRFPQGSVPYIYFIEIYHIYYIFTPKILFPNNISDRSFLSIALENM